MVTVYNSDSIKTNPRVLSGHEGLFLMAILYGGDYDKVSHLDPFFLSILFKSKPKVGLDGCGWKTAHLLAQSELTTTLFTAASTLTSRSELQNFLCYW